MGWDGGMRWEKKMRIYFISRIDSREGTLKLSNLLTTSSQQIIIIILYKRRVIISSSELVCVISQ
jgi:hypothetical protein